MGKNEPFKLSPYGKDYLWGGNRLKSEYNKNLDLDIVAETWEVSTHPDGESKAASGLFENLGLKEIINKNPNFLGTNIVEDDLPIIVKLIDANKDLSIQVHPSNEYAYIHEDGKKGKAEFWYIIDADEDAEIIYGFKKNTSRKKIEEAISNNELEKHLNKVKVKKGDYFFIDSGTIHAIGKNILLAEIQENSNITYRIYDYNRIDNKGNLRELHINKALDVLNYKKNKYNDIVSINEKICDCNHFKVLKKELNNSKIEFQNDEKSFRVFQIIEGDGIISFGNEKIELFKGDSIFIPANSCNMTINGNITYLDISC